MKSRKFSWVVPRGIVDEENPKQHDTGVSDEKQHPVDDDLLQKTVLNFAVDDLLAATSG